MNAQIALHPFERVTARFMPAHDEPQSLEDLRNLNAQAIGAIYDQYYPDVYRYIMYRLGDENAAEDLSSEVFTRLLEATRRNAGPQTNVKGWLIATASHIVVDHLRGKYRRPTEALPDALPDLAAGPQTELESHERDRAVREAMDKLTPEQQHVLSLRFGQGYSLEETASLLNKNVNAVKALQFRALAALQKQLGEADDE